MENQARPTFTKSVRHSKRSHFSAMLVILGLALLASAQAPPTPDRSTARVKLHLDKSHGVINPQIFGHFTEETLTSWEGGASSEILVDRKFSIPEERKPDEPWIAGTGGGWEPIRLARSVTLVQDQQVYYSAPMSQRITNNGGPEPAGVQQPGLRMVFPHVTPLQRVPEPFQVRAGERYRVRLAVKNRDLRGSVKVAIGDDFNSLVASHAIPLRGGEDWKVYQFELVPASAAANAKFMIYTDSPGTVWVDSASLVRADLDDGGFRKDLIAATRLLLPSNIRWPGGWFVSDYHWQDGIGPVDKRPARRNRAWNIYYNNDVGVDDYLAFCQKVGCTPYVVVNVGTGSAEEAAALVEYVNGPANSRWGSVRAKNGHPQPYRVQLWNIGNEEFLPTLGGMSAAAYAKTYLEFARAMRAVDPTIKIVAVGAFELPANFLPPAHPMAPVLRYFGTWGADFFPAAGKEADYYAIHYYEPGDSMKGSYTAEEFHLAAMVIAEDLSRKLAPVLQLMEKSGLRIPIALDEWRMSGPKDGPPGAMLDPALNATSLPDLGRIGPGTSLLNAVSEAAVYNMMQRRPDVFALSSRTILYAYLTGLFGINRDQVVFTPVARMMQMYATRDQCESLVADVQSPTFDVPPKAGFAGAMAAASVDVSARRHPNGQVEVFLVNRDLHPITVEVSIVGGVGLAKATLDLLASEKITDWNTFKSPDSVTVRSTSVVADGGKLTVTMPAHSVGRLRW